MKQPRRAKLSRLPAVWARPAERDLDAIYEHLRVRTRAGTRAVMEGILGTVRRLEEFPLIGARAELVEPVGDLRQFPWRQYLIFYRVRATQLLILRIWDSRRDPASLRVPATPSGSTAPADT